MRLATTSLVAGLASLACLMAGCAALPGVEVAIAAAKKPGAAKPAVKGREIALGVTGPLDLATNGVISSAGGAALFKGGQIVAAGAGNLVAAGAGNIVAAGAGNLVAAGAGNFRLAPTFRLQATEPLFRPVAGAGVQVLDQAGKPVGKAVTVDAEGNVKLKAVPDGKPLTALVAFQVGEKVYRLAVVVPPGKVEDMLMADPINTMVEARVRDLVGTDGKLSALTTKRLDRVWTICHDAGVTVKPDDLTELDPAKSKEALMRVWKDAIDAKVTSAEQKQEIKDFIAELEAAAKAKATD